MKVLVTGGTGFVGSHAAAALVAAGHDVRLLARRPEQVPLSLAPHGEQVAASVDDVVAGDVLDQECVDRALAGVDAVVHAAAVFRLDPRRAEEMTRTNVRAAQLVLGGAAAAGLDPIVHVSSVVALVRHGGTTPDLPLGDVEQPYTVSKREAERFARDLEAAGHPVVAVYPGTVYGPDDPYLSDNNMRLLWLLRGRLPVWPSGGLHTVDVRDVAEVVARAMTPGQGAQRYVVPGHHVDAGALYASAERATGRRLPHLAPPAGLLASAMEPARSLVRHFPARVGFPADPEGIELSGRDTRFDDSQARTSLGVIPRSLEETIRDTALWLVDTGHLSPRRVRAA